MGLWVGDCPETSGSERYLCPLLCGVYIQTVNPKARMADTWTSQRCSTRGLESRPEFPPNFGGVTIFLFAALAPWPVFLQKAVFPIASAYIHYDAGLALV